MSDTIGNIACTLHVSEHLELIPKNMLASELVQKLNGFGGSD